MFTCVCVNLCAHIRMFVCTCICVHLCVCVYLYVYTLVYLCSLVYVYVHLCASLCVGMFHCKSSLTQNFNLTYEGLMESRKHDHMQSNKSDILVEAIYHLILKNPQWNLRYAFLLMV